MRSTKIFSALVALVLTITLAGLVGPAQAAKPRHQLEASGGGSGNNLYLKGVTSTYPNKKVIIQRKLPGKSFVLYKKAKTNANGKFRVNVDANPGTCFKIIVPRTKNYRKKQLAGKRFCIVRS